MAGGIRVVGEVADGALTKLSTEVATLARTLADGGAARGPRDRGRGGSGRRGDGARVVTCRGSGQRRPLRRIPRPTSSRRSGSPPQSPRDSDDAS